MSICTNTLIATLLLFESPRGEVYHDNGRAVGRYAQKSIMIRDVNRLWGTNYQWPRDSLCDETARKIALLYIEAYRKKGDRPAYWYQRYRGGPYAVEKKVGVKKALKWEREYERKVRQRRISPR